MLSVRSMVKIHRGENSHTFPRFLDFYWAELDSGWLSEVECPMKMTKSLKRMRTGKTKMNSTNLMTYEAA